ncbi:RHS repeat-associated core domain-containing protein [Rahnella sikkimica]|uniref:Type IV secretion protein Rhs n=1 Tax=Rahnella sikkimica TaxID=1805933 RepID=A0A2L1UVU1_9GAMM|nr:RHS repeat-associated core domain-containing protein [Rahnella sikkimica]AVF37072.1 hypothetical protein BV494_20120 [Rahnella sikkimica]
MTGFPAARQFDNTAIGGPIVQGSPGVMIGAPTGVACSVCPGGVVVGSPVNPSLGAKVLPGETDIAMPASLPFVLSRSYSSYKTDTPAPVGMFGPGWAAAADIRLQIRTDELILNDNAGRSIHFHHLPPGQIVFSHSENLWLARGGVDKQTGAHPLSKLWQVLPDELRNSPHYYFVANDATGPWWILGCVQLPETAEDVLPRPLPASRLLLGLTDRFGNQLNYHRDAEGEFAGQITGVTDSVGRRFRLELMTLPDFKPALNTGWGEDNGVRLSAVWLTKDLAFPDLPTRPLVRYDYTARGELKTVYDRAGEIVRQFDWHSENTGLMIAHRYAGRPATNYVYDAFGKVISQVNPGGLSYEFEYSKNQTRVTDSLGRLRVYHFEGEQGLRRVVRLEQADCNCTQSAFNNRGQLISQTDISGRTTEFHINPANGTLGAILHPGGEKRSQFNYNKQGQLVCSTAPDGRRVSQEYDAFGRLIAETDALHQTRRYHYADDKSAQPCATEDAAGGRQTLEWNAAGLLIAFTDCSGFKTSYRYNRDGQPVEIQHEEGMKTRFAYDARGRRISREDSAGGKTVWEYNAAGDVIAVTRPDGSQSTQTYDERGNPTAQNEGGLTRQTEFDSAGRLMRLVNENGADTKFSYDVMDRLIQEVGFDGRVQSYQYNAAGQMTQMTTGLGDHHYAYTPAGRLNSVSSPDGFLATFTDAAGNRNCTHPDLNTPLADTLPVWYHNRIQRDERYIYEHDKFGNLTEKRPYRAGWREAPRGAISHFSYDQAHRLTRFTTEEDGLIQTQARYICDPLGRRVCKRVTHINPQSGETETQNIWFGWDGDRLVLTENRDTQLHTIYHPNSFVPLLRAEHTRMEDSHRSLAEKLEEENGIALPTELHLRLNEIEKDIRKNRLSDDNQQWLDAVGLKAENLALWLDPMPEGEALKLQLYHCDHLGTPIALINHKTSKVEWSAVMDVWGNAVDIFNPYKLRQSIRMQGQHYDEESGLHYNRHRYYDPMQGRYITQDPIGLRGGWNLYGYGFNKPNKYIDPRGLNGVGSIVNLPGIGEKGSLAISIMQNGASSEDITTAMAPAPTSPIATGECRVTGTVAVGTGLSATASLNEKSGASALWSVPIAAVGLRASATCGLKFRDPDAKDLKVGAGFALGLGEFSIEVVQTSTWPEIYIGFGAGAGPEINLPYTPSVSGPINY